jgi:hypothetical protein
VHARVITALLDRSTGKQVEDGLSSQELEELLDTAK